MGLLQNSPFFGGAKPHWAVGCPACGVAVLFKSSYPL